ncbi:MAG: LysR family transcriptional regulator [Micromonosporaceae bacterium]
MEVRQLEYFVAVADARHFTRAAERMRVSQSGLSASVRSLERELGAPLFVRNTRRVELTEAGQALLDEARRTLDSLTDTRDAVPPVQGLLRGSVSVGTEQCLGAVDVPALLARFRSAYPGVVITLRQAGSAELLDEIRQGRLDVGFVVASDPLPGGVDLVPLARQPMVLVCHPDHRLAAAQSVKLRALTDEVFVDFRTGWGSRRIADRAFLAAAVDRHVAMEVEDVHTLLHLVEHNLGVALVPNPIARKSKRLRTLAVDDPATPEWRACVATRSGSTVSRATEVLLSLVSS